jgi:hypothetical protein
MTTIVGGSPAQRALLEEILAGFGSDGIDTIELTTLDPAEGWGGGEQIFVNAEDVRTSWEAMLVAIAFRRRSARANLPKVKVIADPGGASSLDYTPRPLPPLSDSELAAFRSDIEAAAGTATLAVEVLLPQAHAFAVTLRVDEPHEYLRYQLFPFIQKMADWRDRCDGTYIEVVDDKPGPAFVTGNYRYGGMGTHREDVACCTPFGRGGLSSPPPPPCPVFDA